MMAETKMWDENPDYCDLSIHEHKINIEHSNLMLQVSIHCPIFIVDGAAYGEGLQPTDRIGDLEAHEGVELKFMPISIESKGTLTVSLFVRWSKSESVLRKWVKYCFHGDCESKILQEIILDCIDVRANTLIEFSPTAVQSHPVILEGFFAGIEYPVSATRKENDEVILAQRPGRVIEAGKHYESQNAVYGIAQRGREKETFKAYIASHGTVIKGVHVNYNSWWTAPLPYTEEDIIKLMATFKEKLHEPYGETFDTFCIDLGWSDPHTLWKINTELFPEGFSKLKKMAESMGSKLGLWVSPSNCYHPHAIDNDWAKEQGYEIATVPWANDTTLTVACLGGQKYLQAFGDSLKQIVRDYGIVHLKLDGCILECPDTAHRHQPGNMSTETIADGIITLFKELREHTPEVWLETTCFGWNPSPWWLFYVNSVIGTYGDDAPYGRIPSPVYRESYTSARDYFNIQGAHHLSIPIKNQEVLGIIHQTGDCFVNDAVMTIMRGHMFLPVYLNPNFMDDEKWRNIARILKWAHTNEEILVNTELIPPRSWERDGIPLFKNEEVMPREPYGYAHWKNGEGLIVLRNPWIMPATHQLRLHEEVAGKYGSKRLDVVSIYPEVRLYAEDMEMDAKLDIALAPYETVVLSVGTKLKKGNIAQTDTSAIPYIEVKNCKTSIELLNGENKAQLIIDANVNVSAPEADMLILLENREKVPVSLYTILIDDIPVLATVNSTEGAWVQSTIKGTENWIFMGVPLNPGSCKIHAEIMVETTAGMVSAWVWARKPVTNGEETYPNELPQPDYLSLDAKALLQPIKIQNYNGLER